MVIVAPRPPFFANWRPVVFLLIATTLEVSGDAWCAWRSTGIPAPGARTLRTLPVLAGGSLIVLGGLIVSFWKAG